MTRVTGWRLVRSLQPGAGGEMAGSVGSVSSDRPVSGASSTAPGRPRLGDVLLAVIVVAAQMVIIRAVSTWHQSGLGIWDYLALAGAGGLLVVRRRYPVAVLAIAQAVTLWVSATSHAGAVWLVLIVAFFNVVLAGRRLAAVASLLIGYLAALWPPWLIGRPGGPHVGFALWLGAGLLLMLCAAELVRLRDQRGRALARSYAEEMRRQASEERMRIARDLHDVVAHNISVINVQANTALHLRDRQPERAWAALATIHEVSKQAMVELRSVLGVLRQAGEDEPRAPAAGLDRIDDLIERAKAAGLTVTLELSGPGAPLPANVDLTAYRIVQEALTNSAKHAAGSAVTVRITKTGTDLRIQVEDEGGERASQQHPSPAPAPGGNGLVGMRERANALHGSLQAGPRPGGGFRVQAVLPLGEETL